MKEFLVSDHPVHWFFHRSMKRKGEPNIIIMIIISIYYRLFIIMIVDE